MGFRLKRFKIPGLSGGKSKFFKLGGALAGPPGNPLQFDKDVIGMRGSARKPGYSVDQAKDKKLGDAQAIEQQTLAARAAAAAAEEETFDKQKESQRKGLLRKGRRASILTSAQGVVDPLGSLG